jgi:hypothetical protein
MKSLGENRGNTLGLCKEQGSCLQDSKNIENKSKNAQDYIKLKGFFNQQKKGTKHRVGENKVNY